MTPPSPIPSDEDTVPYAVFRESPATYMAQTRETHRPVRVTGEGSFSSILLDAADFESYRETLEILRDVAEAEAEAARGETLSPAEVEASLRAEGLL